ncbi:hypothetical protein BO82DRAFT_49830 [Aspergillus uvarum CBS 121591]|uniref:Uncharacterized protein n=1 Tax=Aspergillus uvarum CBS 121591 TaxID=1448315 RepID=A0A319DVI3_9EURO|nr:hypothetical protein BO82DRAFT_49830 [Aspergillus uvarum CBS 121591]PYH83022.1 hypothetical protein BO82DRAFT_49830 [Aspergillus uvarum CBS 121591]
MRGSEVMVEHPRTETMTQTDNESSISTSEPQSIAILTGDVHSARHSTTDGKPPGSSPAEQPVGQPRRSRVQNPTVLKKGKGVGGKGRDNPSPRQASHAWTAGKLWFEMFEMSLNQVVDYGRILQCMTNTVIVVPELSPPSLSPLWLTAMGFTGEMHSTIHY